MCVQIENKKYTFLNLEQTKIEYPEIYTKYGEDFSLNGILFDSISQPTATTRARRYAGVRQSPLSVTRRDVFTHTDVLERVKPRG